MIFYCLHLLVDDGVNILIGLTLSLLRFLDHTSHQNLKLCLEKELANWFVEFLSFFSVMFCSKYVPIIDFLQGCVLKLC